MLEATLGTACGLKAGGLLADLFGWRMTFVLFGLPVLVLSADFYLTVREFQRGCYVAASSLQLANSESLVATLRKPAANHAHIGTTPGYAALIMNGSQ